MNQPPLNPESLRIIISGGGAGIGAALAILYAERGAKVLLCDKADADAVEHGTLSRIEAAPGQARYERCDVTEPTQVQALLNTADAYFGGTIDAFVHCVGRNMRKALLEMEEDEWHVCLETNFGCAFRLSKGLIPMLNSGGAIVFVSSVAALRPRSEDPAYALGKMALNRLTVLLAAEIAERGIRLNAVCPGPTMSDRFLDERVIRPIAVERRSGVTVKEEILKDMPLARFHDCIPPVEAVTDAIDFLISDRARFITGAVLPIDGGKSLPTL